MRQHANAVATWLTILTMLVGGGIWVGTVASEVQNTKTHTAENRQQIDKLRNEGPPAIARLEAQVTEVQKDVEEVKRSQEEILRELRKK
jgi:uncharacterized protein YlxW (UPF0749 family)